MGHQLRNNRKKPEMREAFARAFTHELEQEELIFADENAKTAWQVGQEVDRVLALLPAEGLTLNTRTITFDPENRSRGTYAVFFSGTVFPTDRKGVLVVPERSLRILDRLQISYQLL
jgi:hypothetical protein